MTGSPSGFTNGALYERCMGRWSRAVGRQFLTWLEVPKGAEWLDVGCGNGAFSEEIAAGAAPARIVGIDPSDSQIEAARARPATPGLSYQSGDAQDLPFADASFDAATMALVIAFVPDPAKGVAEMLRVIRPGGRVGAYMWDLPMGVPLHPIYAEMREMGLGAPMPPSVGYARLDRLVDLWTGAGLTQVTGKVIHITVNFDDFEDFWSANTLMVGPLAQTVAAMDPAARETLRDRVRARLAPAADGRITYGAFANAVKGTKAG